MSFPIAAILDLGGKVLDRVIPDKGERDRAKHELALLAANGELERMKIGAGVVQAEAQGEGVLQKNWRPITMLTFVGLIGAHWLGFTPENMDKEQVLALLDIVQIGLGGYVIGRSAEKGIKAWRGDA